MAAADLKTKVSDADVSAFVASVDNPVRRADAETLLDLFQEVTGMEPKMWGPSIIGYGSYHYKYDSGREGDWCRAGFSPRKANLSVYLMGGYCNPDTQTQVDALRARLGKHKVGASCLYITKLVDVDIEALKDLIAFDLSWMDSKYPR
jgi:Domain of unknown function (DU1801)